ncbi:FxSxx-COOH system tetratricopeptide repeat protein [Streptomyces sp. NPDC050704]|uniref:FxSxx-COOH system tetratricopeptide repeat protein n=1 Tax=Streptomyces sp. NPDC050704 TaxID=3157219 RepID=UPI00342CFA84
MGDAGEPTTTRPATRTGRQTVTISFAGLNRAWAAWIRDRLERHGHRAVYQRWNPPPGTRLEESLRDLLLAPGPVLLVISDWYLQQGSHTPAEWADALRQVVAPDEHRFVAVSVAPSAPPTATAVLDAVELTGVDADEAERRLLARLGLPFVPVPESDQAARHGPRFPSGIPQVSGGVPRPNARFTGREQLLSDTYEQLLGGGAVTLCGMSGVGKTQLAAEYAHRFGSEYDLVWWVNAGNRTSFRRELAELAPALGLSTGAEYGERLRAVRDALRRGDPYAHWLLILDGADEPGQIQDLVPTGPGHILITSRNSEWAEHNSALEVPVYDRPESVAFIRRRAPRLTETEADRLAEALEDLPLLLDQTAGWLNDSDVSIGEYLELLNADVEQSAVTVSADFPLTFRTAWSVLLDSLRESAPESVELLRLCTFFAPGLVPVRLLRQTPVDGLPEHLAGLLGDQERWDRAIGQLRRSSVVRLEYERDEPSGAFLYVHRMVHQTVRNDMSDEDRREYAGVVRRALAAADPGRPADTDMWPRYAEIVPHLEYADVPRDTVPAIQELVLNCLRYMYLSGEYGAGVRLAEQAVPAWQERPGTSETVLWELGHHYANLLRACGEYRHSETVSRAAVEQYRAAAGTPGHGHLRSVGSLAADLRALARYDEALSLSREVVEGYEQLLGEVAGADRHTLLAARNNLAVSLRLLGRYRQALDIDERTLADRRRFLGADDVWTLDSQISCATDLRLLGRYSEAVSLQERSVHQHREVTGANHQQTLRAEHNLALCRHRVGDRDAAGPLLAGVLQRCERVLGETDPLTLILATSQSCFAREYGSIDEARRISESVVARYEDLLGPPHPYAAGARANHALILRSVGEREAAYGLAESSLAGMASAVGGDHPWTLGCALNASALRNLLGDPESAVALSRDTAARAATTLGGTHPLTLSARIGLAADLRTLGQPRQAEKAEAEALNVLAATLGPEHLHTVAARSRVRPYWDFEPQTT